jgi:cell division protease FtsH
MKYRIRKTLRVLLWTAIIYAVVLVPLLYFLYRTDHGLDWWNVLGGDPRVPPEYRHYVLTHNTPYTPHFNLLKTTVALPWIVTQFFVIIVYVLLFIGGQFWFFMYLASRGRQYTIYPGEYDVTFDDVKGQPEIVSSTKEALTLFQGFKKFREAGGYPPHGILFEGPPGTGKTLLGKAIAGSAKVPFIYANGSSFVSMWMGGGQLSINRLFRRARKFSNKYGGAVIFIDELDAVGGTRGAVSTARTAERRGIFGFFVGGMGMGGGQGSMYINELLTQMDGMTVPRGLKRHLRRLLHLKPKIPQHNIMVIGATNQVSSLDPALLRPGRFDRKLHVGNPDARGREDVLRYYLDKVPHDDIDVGRLARATGGFSPAQIKNMVNEALIFALMDNRDRLTFTDLWDAKVTEELGLKEPDRMSPRERQMTAFHEAGHAIAMYVLELDNQLGLVTIVKRQRTLGHVSGTPIEERHSAFREDIRRDIVVSMAGMAAEDIWFGDTTSGPSGDLEHATRAAITMFGRYGMGDTKVSFEAAPQASYELWMHIPEYRRVINKLLQDCLEEAKQILRANERAVRALVELLLEKGEVDGAEVEALMRAKGVARSTPTFRPALELTGIGWHAPALVERTDGDKPGSGDAPVLLPPSPTEETPGGGSAGGPSVGGPRDRRAAVDDDWWRW